MNPLYLLQFACLIFMLINAFILAVTHLHVSWKNKRFERSRGMILIAMIGLALQYFMQMFFGFRATDANLGAIINILIYTPCFTLISMGIYNIEATHANRRKFHFVCTVIYIAIIAIFALSSYLNQGLYIGKWLYVMLALYFGNVVYCIYMIVQEMIKRKNMLETMAASDMLPYVRYARSSVVILFLAALIMPFAIPLQHIVVHRRTFCPARPSLLQPQLCGTRQQLHSYRRTVGQGRRTGRSHQGERKEEKSEVRRKDRRVQ